MSKKRKIAIALDCILIALTLFFIFGNSLQNVERSTNISEGVTEIVEALPPVQNAIDNGVIEKGSLEGTLRSLAHAAEFCLLCGEVMLLFLLMGIKPLRLSVYLPFFICLLISIADECIQMLTDRAAEVVDILKDFAGSLVGGLSVLAIYAVIMALKKRKEK